MAFDHRSYPRYFRQTQDYTYLRPFQPDEGQSFRSRSFASSETIELEQYHADSSQTGLLSPSSNPDGIRLPSHRTSTSSRVFAKTGPGLWKNQMLVDRSLRGMALLTSIFALVMLIIVFVWLPPFIRLGNTESTSVLADEESCKASANKILVRM